MRARGRLSRIDAELHAEIEKLRLCRARDGDIISFREASRLIADGLRDLRSMKKNKKQKCKQLGDVSVFPAF